jgi:mono/diheme cytochrome c family protein
MNGGYWLWMHSPEQEKVVAMGLFNRYCIRCHGGDGRGVWDIPGIPDFSDVRWQSCRTDDQIVRIIIEGRGAVMPPFRGALSVDEAWGIARYLRTFVPGTEVSKPDLGSGGGRTATPPAPTTSVNPAPPRLVTSPAAPPPSAPGRVASPLAR